MIKRELPGTDLTLSVIGLGCWAIGGTMWGQQDDADSIAAIHAAVDAGVNWLDTAPIYGFGRSERVVGEALRQMPVDRRPLVFTKFGLGAEATVRRCSATRAEIINECDASLARLGVAQIDLFQLHWAVPQPVDEVANACASLVTQGKIRCVGVCNYSIAEVQAWQATKLPLHSLQVPYSLFRSAAGEQQIPWGAAHGLGSLAYSPLFRGMLTGTWDPAKGFPADDARGDHVDYRGARLARHLAAIDELRVIAADDELTVAQLAIGALLITEGLTGCIVGARNAAQGSALGELAIPIKAKQQQAIDEVLLRLTTDLEHLAKE